MLLVDVPRSITEVIAMQEWTKPDFEEIFVNCECTAYAGVE
jgi:hypothetical protein